MFIPFCKAISEFSGGKAKILLPGGDPFFIDQLFAELVANNGGILFNPSTYKPLFTSRQVVETFEFLGELSPLVDAGWQTQGYLDQFNRFGRGEAGVVPVTYVRATKAIENAIVGSGSQSLKGTPEYFALMDQPIGPSFSGPSIATIDCEPFVIFKSAESRRTEKSNNADYAKKFLRMFYKRTNYINFVSTVPIHLTPIFKGMSRSEDYTSLSRIKTWRQWADQTAKYLENPKRVRPILMPDITEAGRAIPFLLEFQANRIISQAVMEVVSKKKTPKQAAESAQSQAEQLIQNLGYKKW
jgi:ABC-type glycerol-3-phosphate transport system substrate-binding protein